MPTDPETERLIGCSPTALKLVREAAFHRIEVEGLRAEVAVLKRELDKARKLNGPAGDPSQPWREELRDAANTHLTAISVRTDALLEALYCITRLERLLAREK